MSNSASFFGCKYEIRDGGNYSQYVHDISAAFEIMKPKASPRPLIRIGPDSDGGYLVPDDLDGVTTCFSPGVSNRKDFEDHLTRAFGIKCHMCDYSSNVKNLESPLIEGMQTFRKVWLDIDGSDNSISLDEWIGQLSPPPHEDLLLQMDIEGAEYRNILSCSPDVLARFRIMVFEIHDLQFMLNYDVLGQLILPFLQKIDKSFVCVHVHPNNYGGEFTIPELGANMPTVLELTFLRKDRIGTATGSGLFSPLIPHPRDIIRNGRERPPMFLNDVWVGGDRPLPSRVRLLEDEVAYMKYKNMVQANETTAVLEASVKIALQASAAVHLPGSGIVPADAGSVDLEEIGAGSTYFLSSRFGTCPLSGVVPNEERDFFFHTGFGINQSITIDIGTIRTVKIVTIGNRRDGCRDRARLLFLILHTEQNREGGEVFFIDAPPGFVTGTDVQAKIFLPPIEARYVTILSPLHTALHFSFLRLFAAPHPPARVRSASAVSPA